MFFLYRICSSSSIAVLLFAFHCFGATYYSDPVKGSNSNDGSYANPWGKMQDIVDDCKIKTQAYEEPWSTTVPERLLDKCPNGVVQSGDTIYLMSGYQGELILPGMVNTNYIKIKAYPGQTPTFKRLYMLGAAYWEFDGVTVSPEFDTPLAVYANGIIEIEKHLNKGPCDHITIKNSTVYSVSDNLASWPTLLDWFNGASRGIVSVGHYNKFEGNTIRNTEGCISTGESNFVEITRNNCSYQSGDVIAVSDADDLLVEHNILTDIIPSSEVYEDTHPDMMQISSYNKQPSIPMYRATIRQNYANASLHYGTHPLVGGNPQGITGFDGMLIDSVIENNIVVVNSPHGITYYGLRNSVIVNNTSVYNPLIAAEQTAPIRIGHSKIDTITGLSYDSIGNTVINNITTSVSLEIIAPSPGVADHNIENVVLSTQFVDYASNNYQLPSTASNAINMGISTLAPTVDYAGDTRVGLPDIGAYEYLGATSCDSTNLNLCTTQSTCEASSGHFCGGVCGADVCVIILPFLTNGHPTRAPQ